jgi:HAE1 family hydrophobic/amphiphilic exporter-1
LSELKRVNGGDQGYLGTREYAMRILIKPDRIGTIKFSSDEVMEALSSQSLEAPGKTGGIWKRSQGLSNALKYSGRFHNPEQYGNSLYRVLGW